MRADILPVTDHKLTTVPASRAQAGVAARALVALLLISAFAARAEGEFLPGQPIVEGREIFEKKGCLHCHSIRGSQAEQEIGPNLASKAASWRDVMRFAGALWNHLPEMIDNMRAQHIERSTFSPREMRKLTAYLFYAKFLGEPGDVTRGRELFEQRMCARCHQMHGRGGTEGPRLDELKDHVSCYFMALTMWNHGPEMAEKAEDIGLVRPRLDGRDVAHIVAFIRGEAKGPAVLEMAQAQAGVPHIGESLFRAKGCIQCHTVDGTGGALGPELDRQRQNLDISDLAGTFWNHGARMWAKMKEIGVPFPRLTEREMSNLLAYLAYLQYMGPRGDAARGGELFHEKTCSGCHPVAGGGASVGPDLAQSYVLQSVPHWTAAMWNHAPPMDMKLREQKRPWPRFEDDEMRDVVAFLQSRSESK